MGINSSLTVVLKMILLGLTNSSFSKKRLTAMEQQNQEKLIHKMIRLNKPLFYRNQSDLFTVIAELWLDKPVGVDTFVVRVTNDGAVRVRHQPPLCFFTNITIKLVMYLIFNFTLPMKFYH